MDAGKKTERFIESLLELDRLGASALISELTSELTPDEIIEQLIVPALDHVGDAWERGALALSQIYMSGRICEELIEQLLPPESEQRKSSPRIALTVYDDYHMLGKRIVYSFLRASGYDLLDFGRTGLQELVRRTIEEQVEILLISVLMLPSALRIKELKQELARRGSSVKIVVGGAPFRLDPGLGAEVGADAVAVSATQAPEIIRSMEPEHNN